jgi:hypothetical protein
MGLLLSTHAVDTGRRRVLGRVLLVVALVSAVLPAAVVLLRGSGRPELIELYEHGLAHHCGGVRREWTWDQVEAVDTAERGASSCTGSDLGCTIRFADGALLHFTGLTENSTTIVAALAAHCPAAARVPVRKPTRHAPRRCSGASRSPVAGWRRGRCSPLRTPPTAATSSGWPCSRWRAWCRR